MIVTKKHLPRRTFLRGMGVSLALPLLDSMGPAFGGAAARAAEPIRRLGVVYVPNGMFMPNWTPTIENAPLEIMSTLQPLAAHRRQPLAPSCKRRPCWMWPSASASSLYIRLTGHATKSR